MKWNEEKEEWNEVAENKLTLRQRAKEHAMRHPNDVGATVKEWTEETGRRKKRFVKVAGLGTACYTKVNSPKRRVVSYRTVKELKEECKAMGLKVGGKKADLIERLDAHYATLRGEEE